MDKFGIFEKTYNKELKQDENKELNPCMDIASCRSIRQITFIAFCRMNKFNVKFVTGSNIQSFLLEIAGDFAQKGVSRYSFQTTFHEDKGELKFRNDTPVFKACVPTDVAEQGWIDYLCPYSACAKNYETSKNLDKCKVEENVLNGKLHIKMITTDIGGSTPAGFF
jgi:hypothetical protein